MSRQVSNMPIPSPKGKQSKDNFISSCISDEKMIEEFPDRKQRAAVCYSQWKKSKGTVEIDFTKEIRQKKSEKGDVNG